MRLFLFLATALALCTAPLVAQGKPLHVNPIAGLDPDFIRGADVSTLLSVEKNGGQFFDAAGKPADALKILRDHGVNWVRLRLWNDPVSAGSPLGGGDNHLATDIALAQRAKALGLKVLLDFHYSDFWADPSHQVVPKAWAGFDRPDLERALYQFTKASLESFAAAGALPDMVQLGNETNGGMLWPHGKTWQATPDEVVGGYEGFAALLNAGSRAVREVSPDIRIAVHLADGGDHGLYRSMLDQLFQRSVDFDIVGFSYYPFWHGALEQLADNLNTVSVRYGKPVVVMETAYARGIEDADGFGNVFGMGMDRTGGYKATLQGQATAVRDVAAAVADVPGGQGLGFFYWEPAWLPVKGAGWRAGEGNNWDNLTFFDSRGKVLPSLAVFRLIGAEGEGIDPVPVAALPVAFTVALDQKNWVLPEEVLAAYSDDSYHLAPVTWNAFDRAKITKPQVTTLKGTLTGTKVAVSARVSVVPLSNLLTDAGFESGVLGDWKVEGPAGAVLVEKNAGNAHSGEWTLKYWKEKEFSFTARRVIEALVDGTYTVKLWSMGGGGEKAIRFSARSADGLAGPEVRVVNTGWLKWNQYTLSNVQVKRGMLELSIAVDARDGSWGNFDDLELVREGDLKP